MAEIRPNASIVVSLINRTEAEQQEDGGWVDCEDTAWATAVLAVAAPHKQDLRQRAFDWLAIKKFFDYLMFCLYHVMSRIPLNLHQLSLLTNGLYL